MWYFPSCCPYPKNIQLSSGYAVPGDHWNFPEDIPYHGISSRSFAYVPLFHCPIPTIFLMWASGAIYWEIYNDMRQKGKYFKVVYDYFP